MDKPTDPDTSEVQLVIIGSGFTPGAKDEFWAQYDFSNLLQRGNPKLSDPKVTRNPEMDLTEGLYAQVLVWTGDPTSKLSIDQIKLDVEVELI
jgi:hypothetical protein